MEFDIAPQANKALSILHKNGYEAYLVGGCIRDIVMGMNPKDWDITTNARPEDIIKSFNAYRVFPTGIKHGTVTVILDKLPIEITTFRTESNYSDGRRPDNVEFVGDLKQDLSRRDFTMNALAYDGQMIFDYFNGREDINNRLIRSIGDPNERFNEDALRILRALRFSSVLCFDIDQETEEAIFTNKRLLNRISSERISSEFNRILTAKNTSEILDDYKEVIAVFIPEIEPTFSFDQNNPYHDLDIWQHTLKAIHHSKPDLIIRLSLFFHDIGKPHCYTIDNDKIGHFYGHEACSVDLAEKVLKRLKYDIKTIDKVKKLIEYHDLTIDPNEKSVKRALNKIGEDLFPYLLKVKSSDGFAHRSPHAERCIDEIYQIQKIYKKILSDNQCFSLKDLAINGQNLIEIGFKEGIEIGNILIELLDAVIDGKIINEKESLLKFAEKQYKNNNS